MPTCSFCKKHYNFPRGLTVFLFDGKALHFCSSKCKRNLALKRDPKKVNWVKRKKKGKKAELKAEKLAAIKEETSEEETSEVEKKSEKTKKKEDKKSNAK